MVKGHPKFSIWIMLKIFLSNNEYMSLKVISLTHGEKYLKTPNSL